jgi:hypothetical protein
MTFCEKEYACKIRINNAYCLGRNMPKNSKNKRKICAKTRNERTKTSLNKFTKTTKTVFKKKTTILVNDKNVRNNLSLILFIFKN